VLDLVSKAGMLRPRDLDVHEIPREHLHRLHQRGLVVRHGPGIYTLPGADLGEHFAFAAACKRVPQGVVCLLSALRFHEMTTQVPYEVWLAIDRKARAPEPGGAPLRVVRFSGDALRLGVEEHDLEGVTVRVYGPAKTVADCWKYRHKIGLDVALEALRDFRRLRRGSLDDLWRFARVCRVARVMRPYLEALG
jgi:predicted transcriptional regulator of viral defense system